MVRLLSVRRRPASLICPIHDLVGNLYGDCNLWSVLLEHYGREQAPIIVILLMKSTAIREEEIGLSQSILADPFGPLDARAAQTRQHKARKVEQVLARPSRRAEKAA